MPQTKKSFSVVLETAEPGSGELLRFLKTNSIKTVVVEKSSKSHSGFDEIEYSADTKAKLEELIDAFWHDDSLKEYID